MIWCSSQAWATKQKLGVPSSPDDPSRVGTVGGKCGGVGEVCNVGHEGVHRGRGVDMARVGVEGKTMWV